MAMQGYDLPPELDADRRRLERQQRMADALFAQGQAQMQTQTAGGYVIPISPFSGAAKMLAAYASKRKGEQVDRGMEDISKRYNEGLAQAVRDYSASGSRQVQAPDFGAMTGGMDEQDAPMRQETVQADPRERLIAAMTSPYAPVRQLGAVDFQASQKDKEMAETRAFRQQEAQAARDARAAELQQRLADARTTAAERAALQRELQQMNIQGRQDMVRLAAQMRPAPQAQPAQIIQTDTGIYERNRDGTLKPLVDPATNRPLQPKPSGNAKGKGDVEATMDVYTQASNGLITGLKGTETGPIAGRMPAMTTAQQTAEGGVAAMAPVLKQMFRVAGEGVFTDKDQELLMKMVPTRTDTPEAAQNKIDNIDNIVSAKLGIPPPDRPWRDKNAPITTPRRRASDAEPPPGAVRRLP